MRMGSVSMSNDPEREWNEILDLIAKAEMIKAAALIVVLLAWSGLLGYLISLLST